MYSVYREESMYIGIGRRVYIGGIGRRVCIGDIGRRVCKLV